MLKLNHLLNESAGDMVSDLGGDEDGSGRILHI